MAGKSVGKGAEYDAAYWDVQAYANEFVLTDEGADAKRKKREQKEQNIDEALAAFYTIDTTEGNSKNQSKVVYEKAPMNAEELQTMKRTQPVKIAIGSIPIAKKPQISNLFKE